MCTRVCVCLRAHVVLLTMRICLFTLGSRMLHCIHACIHACIRGAAARFSLGILHHLSRRGQQRVAAGPQATGQACAMGNRTSVCHMGRRLSNGAIWAEASAMGRSVCHGQKRAMGRRVLWAEACHGQKRAMGRRLSNGCMVAHCSLRSVLAGPRTAHNTHAHAAHCCTGAHHPQCVTAETWHAPSRCVALGSEAERGLRAEEALCHGSRAWSGWHVGTPTEAQGSGI